MRSQTILLQSGLGRTRRAAKVSTLVLLQARHHFATRQEPREMRAFFPTGNVAKAHGEPNRLHARARGEMVDAAEEAETVFSIEAGTPYELERIASEFMA